MPGTGQHEDGFEEPLNSENETGSFDELPLNEMGISFSMREPNLGVDIEVPLYLSTFQFVQGLSAREFALKLKDLIDFRGDENVLVSGCREGFFPAACLSPLFREGKIVSFDKNPGMVKHAVKTYGNTDQLSFFDGVVFCDVPKVIEAAGLETGKIDLVLSNGDHHWLFKPEWKEQAYQALYNELKSGGTLVDCPFRDGCLGELFKIGFELAKESQWYQPYFNGVVYEPTCPTIDEMYDPVSKAGFSNIRTEEIDNTRTFDDENSLKIWVTACFRPFMTEIANSMDGKSNEVILGKQYEFASEIVNRYGKLTVEEKLTQIVAHKE